MISTLSRVIHYPDTNSVEATWVDSSTGQILRCHSYSDRQMDMLVEDLGESVSDHQEVIDLVLLNQQPIPPEPEPIPVVYSCSPWQIRKALNALELRAGVEAAVEFSTDQELKDGWEFATEFRSDDTFVLSMGASMGKTPEETVALIQFASTL